MFVRVIFETCQRTDIWTGIYTCIHRQTDRHRDKVIAILGTPAGSEVVNNNNNIHICIAPYGRNFRGAKKRKSGADGKTLVQKRRRWQVD